MFACAALEGLMGLAFRSLRAMGGILMLGFGTRFRSRGVWLASAQFCRWLRNHAIVRSAAFVSLHRSAKAALLCLLAALLGFLPNSVSAASPGCNAISGMSGIFTIDGSGNGTERFTDLAAQPVADGETITYTWSGNTKGAYVSILWTHSGGTAYGTDAIIDSTASSGSGHFTLTGTGPGDYFQVAVMDTNFDSQTNVAARNSSVSISLTCASGAVLGVAMSHVGNAAQGGLMSYTITPSTLGEATTSALLTASLNVSGASAPRRRR